MGNGKLDSRLIDVTDAVDGVTSKVDFDAHVGATNPHNVSYSDVGAAPTNHGIHIPSGGNTSQFVDGTASLQNISMIQGVGANGAIWSPFSGTTNTEYTNSNSYPIVVNIHATYEDISNPAGLYGYVGATTANLLIAKTEITSGISAGGTISLIVPANWVWKYTGGGTGLTIHILQ